MPELLAVAAGVTVPTQIHYVWVGGPIPGAGARHDYRRAIAEVRSVMTQRFEVNVWLSQAYSAAGAYEQNRDWCRQQTGVTVRSCDELALRETERRALQVQWELPDQPNYGAMSDILRVAILDQLGGIYLDTDCSLTTPIAASLPCHYGFAATRMSWCSNALINSLLASVPAGVFVRALRDSITETYGPVVALKGDALFAALRYPTDMRKRTDDQAGSQKRSDIEAKTLRLAGPTRLDLVACTFKVHQDPADPGSPLRELRSFVDDVWKYAGVQEFVIPHLRMPDLPQAKRERLALCGTPIVESHASWLPPRASLGRSQPRGDALSAPVTAPVGAPVAGPSASARAGPGTTSDAAPGDRAGV